MLSRAAVHSAAGTDYTGADGHLPSPPEETTRSSQRIHESDEGPRRVSRATPPAHRRQRSPAPSSKPIRCRGLAGAAHARGRRRESMEASLDQLPPASLPPSPGVCYPALRRLPGRDSHPLELCSVTQPSFALPGSQPLRRNGAPCKPAYLRARDARVIRGGARPEQSNRSRRACAVTVWRRAESCWDLCGGLHQADTRHSRRALYLAKPNGWSRSVAASGAGFRG